MTLQLVEGQDFSANYSLLQRIAVRDNGERWLALDKASSERVLLRIFDTPLSDAMREKIERAIDTGRGLIHPNIVRVYRLEHGEGYDFIVSQYVASEQIFSPNTENFASRWPLLEQLIDALAFAHSLGVAHGHIHPGNLLVDSRGHLHVTDFGLPSQPGNGEYETWLSPQVQSGATPDRSDDIYGLGYLLYFGLTGKEWRNERFETDSPIPEDLQRLIISMLAQSPYDRPLDLDRIRDLARRYILGESDVPLEALGSYTRAGTAQRAETTGTERPRLQRESRVMSAPVAFGGFAALLAIAAFVFFLLPGEGSHIPATPRPAATQPVNESEVAGAASRPAPPKLTPLDIAKQKELEKQGDAVANQLLKLQVGLEDVGVQIWAPDKYQQVQDISSKADAAYRGGDFNGAIDLYKKGIAILADLKSQVGTVKSENLDKGKSALDAGDSQAAIRAYTIVNAIEPNNKDVKQALARAENLDQVLSLIKDGEFLEADGKLDEAHEKFVAAYKLDPDWTPAKQGLDRIEHKIAKRKFDDAMSIAFTALGNHQYDRARAAFHDAQKILPASKEPGDGLQQVEIAIKQEKIDTLRDQAQAAEKAEDWAGAITTYQKILDLDPTLVFASNGLEHGKARLDLEKQMNRYIADPALMASDAELASARTLLARAARIDGPGDKLTSQMDSLSELIAMARIPVPVQVTSDGKTDVTVYKVGHLGKIDSTALQLIPGQYTIVGQRDGYRDAQQVITVAGGHATYTVNISCTERI